jgi:Cupin
VSSAAARSPVAPWGLELPATTGASFHAVISGMAWLRVDGLEPPQLMPGDLLLLATWRSHRLASDPSARDAAGSTAR